MTLYFLTRVFVVLYQQKLMESSISGKRQEIRKLARDEQKRKMMEKQWGRLPIRRRGFEQEIFLKGNTLNRQQIYAQCKQDIDEAYNILGTILTRNPGSKQHFQEAYQRMLRYSQCKHYCWVVLLIINYMIDIEHDGQAFVSDYLPILDRFLDKKNNFFVIQRGITGVYLIQTVKTAPLNIIRMRNFEIFMNQYAIDSSQCRVQFLIIETITKCIKFCIDSVPALSIIIELGWIKTLAKLLGQKIKQTELVQSTKHLAKHQIFLGYILADAGLDLALRAKQAMADNNLTKEMSQLWKQFVITGNAEQLTLLVSRGLQNILRNGVEKYNDDVENATTCLQAVEILLDKLSSFANTENQYFKLKKNLQANRLTQILSTVQIQSALFNNQCERILKNHFDTMIVE